MDPVEIEERHRWELNLSDDFVCEKDIEIMSYTNAVQEQLIIFRGLSA